MNPTVRIASAAIAAILAFAALTSNASMTRAFAHEGHTDFVTNAEYIKGHLEQAISNKQAGNLTLTIAHSGHPIHEVFTLMEGPLSEESPQRAADLKAALEALPNAASSDSLQAFTDKVTEINGMLDEAVTVFAGDEATELGSVVTVISNLLETSELEYEEGVAGGEIVEMIEYQDASGFIGRANSLFTDIQDRIEAQEEAEEIEQFFGQLVSAVNSKADPEDVSTLIGGIIHEFEEAVPSQSENEHVEFAANIEFIKGHLTKAVENKQAGNTSLAIAHSGHPVEEVYALIQGELAEHNATLNTNLNASLSQLATQAVDLSATDFQNQVTMINQMIDEALDSVIGQSEQNDPKFNAQVAIALLETAEHEYEEAVSGGKIVEMIEYQDSTAFIERAELIFGSIKAELPAHEAEEIEGFFAQLNSLTESNASFEEVETVIGGIVLEFEEAVGLEGEEGKLGGWEYIARINELLDQVVTEYETGNAQKAKALAIEAYLDNYEHIETDIKQDDPTLMLKIEEDMRVELVKMIDQQASSSAIESHVQAIKVDLEQAKTVVVPEFPAVIAIVAATMAIIIGLGKTGRLRLGSGSL